MNDKRVEDSPDPSPPMPQQRRVFLITYSQANLEVFPNCGSFAEAIVAAFGPDKVKEWACCHENHQDGGAHYHMSINLKSSRRWGPVKRAFLSMYGVSLHFSIKTFGYVAAYRYVCKNKKLDDVAHSSGHTNMVNIGSPKTKKAIRQSSDNKAEKRKSSGTTSKEKKLKRLSNAAVSNLMVKENITKESELMRLALNRAQNGEPDLQAFILNKNPKSLSDLISTTWKMQNAEKVIVRNQKSRMQLIQECVTTNCVEGCGKVWLQCAKEILQNNGVNLYYFACALRQALQKGRQKNINILIVGPTNCGKSFLLNPLEMIYKAFVNPANARYAWIGLEECEVAFLNDFRWTPEIIAWSDFLLLLEGQTVHLPRPKNQFSSDMEIDRKNTIPFFATSKGPIDYIGKYNVRDERESDMMASRWHMFTFHQQIARPKAIEPCTRCFSELVLEGVQPGVEL